MFYQNASKMIVIADGGSTKVDWRFISDSKKFHDAHSIGFNPFYFKSQEVIEELSKEFIQANPVKEAKKVYFYGSGCSDEYRCSILADAFRVVFPNALIEVDHDLLASARATCGHEPGIACILGTGSNSALYDGKQVIDNVTNLGFFLGDEGSGSHLGKALITAYYYRELPPELSIKLEAFHKMGKRELLNNIYGDSPNVFLASFSKFFHENKDHFFIQKLVNKSFGEFIDRHVCKYEGHLNMPIHFVGSIAFYFRDILQVTLQERNLTLGNIVKRPIDSLVNFHLALEN